MLVDQVAAVLQLRCQQAAGIIAQDGQMDMWVATSPSALLACTVVAIRASRDFSRFPCNAEKRHLAA